MKDVTPILKLFQNQIKSFHDKNRIWTNVSNFWIIQNNTPVVERIDKINQKKKAVSIRTFDFSALQSNLSLADTHGTTAYCPLLGGVRYREVQNFSNEISSKSI